MSPRGGSQGWPMAPSPEKSKITFEKSKIKKIKKVAQQLHHVKKEQIEKKKEEKDIGGWPTALSPPCPGSLAGYPPDSTS